MEKSETLKRISNVILGYATYNTFFESSKYEFKVPEYDHNYSYNWTESESEEIITLVTKNVDCADTVKKKSTLIFDVSIFYYIEKNVLNEVHVEISNIRSNYKSGNVLINDFNNNMVQYLLAGIYSIYDGRDYIAVDGEEEKTRIELHQSPNVGVVMNRNNGTALSIRNLFINDLDVMYKLTNDKSLVNDVRKYSPTLAKALTSILNNQNQIVSNIYKKSDNVVPIDSGDLEKDFKDMKIVDGKTYLFNITLHKMVRSGKASLADILTLFDSNGIELIDIKYLMKF